MKNIYCKDLDTHQTLCYTYKCQGECTRSLSCTFSVLLTRKNEKGLCMSQFRLMHSPSFYGGNQVIVSIRTLSKKMRRKESRHSTAFFLRIFMLQLLWGRDIACRTPRWIFWCSVPKLCAIAKSIVSTSTLALPRLRKRRNPMSALMLAKTPSAWMLRLTLNCMPSSDVRRAFDAARSSWNVFATAKHFIRSSKGSFDCSVCNRLSLHNRCNLLPCSRFWRSHSQSCFLPSSYP